VDDNVSCEVHVEQLHARNSYEVHFSPEFDILLFGKHALVSAGLTSTFFEYAAAKAPECSSLSAGVLVKVKSVMCYRSCGFF
jgi:hypothetical protein